MDDDSAAVQRRMARDAGEVVNALRTMAARLRKDASRYQPLQKTQPATNSGSTEHNTEMTTHGELYNKFREQGHGIRASDRLASLVQRHPDAHIPDLIGGWLGNNDQWPVFIDDAGAYRFPQREGWSWTVQDDGDGQTELILYTPH